MHLILIDDGRLDIIRSDIECADLKRKLVGRVVIIEIRNAIERMQISTAFARNTLGGEE